MSLRNVCIVTVVLLHFGTNRKEEVSCECLGLLAGPRIRGMRINETHYNIV